MNPYRKYKPSGIEWIGDIPVQWLVRKLKYNTYIKARVGWHGLKSDEFSKEGAFCVTGTDFIHGTVKWETCYCVSYERYNEDPYIQLKENDLLITKDGTIGKVAVVKGLTKEATLNSGVFVVRPETDEYHTDYLYWVLQSTAFTEFVKYISKGSTIIHLYQDTFINFPLIFPSVAEQKIIVRYLNEKTSQIDTLIANKQRLIALLKEERAAIINEAVTKGIDKKAKLKPSGIEWLGNVPEHWEVKKLKYVAEVNPQKSLSGFIKDDDTPVVFLPMEQVNEDGTYDTTIRKPLKEVWNGFTYFQSEDVIVAKITPCFENGKGAYLEQLESTIGFGSTEFHVIRATDKILPQFIYLIIKSDRFMTMGEAYMSGAAGQKRVPTDFIENFLVALPSRKEQGQIANTVRAETSKIDYTISRIEKEIELMQEYRTALISEVVTGKIDVRAYATEGKHINTIDAVSA